MKVAPNIIREHKPLMVLLGPTAVGKSRVAIPLAQALQTDILTADSRQVYRGMNIGMDKPTPEDCAKVPHRLIDLIEPDQSFNAGEYRRLALTEICRLHQESRIPLIVGGTGLYIRVLTRGLCEGPAADRSFRQKLETDAHQRGTGWLHRQLAAVDPDLAERLHPHDKTKIIRGLEVHHLLGRPLSRLHAEHGFHENSFATLLIGLTRKKESLHQSIEARVDAQLQKGLLRETQTLLARGYDCRLGSMKSLGYRQIVGYLSGDYSYEEAVRRLKQDTRHFAKRQMTWFRKEPDVQWISVEQNESTQHVAARILMRMEQFISGLTDRVERTCRFSTDAVAVDA